MPNAKVCNFLLLHVEFAYNRAPRKTTTMPSFKAAYWD